MMSLLELFVSVDVFCQVFVPDFISPANERLRFYFVAFVLFVPFGIVGTWKMKSFQIKAGWTKLTELFKSNWSSVHI
jgi:hypothetical protein